MIALSVFSQPAIWLGICLLLIIIGVVILLIILRITFVLRRIADKREISNISRMLDQKLEHLNPDQIDRMLNRRAILKEAQALNNVSQGINTFQEVIPKTVENPTIKEAQTALVVENPVSVDPRGLVTYSNEHIRPSITYSKSTTLDPLETDAGLRKLIFAFLICATGWLIFGTLIGEYVGIKFLAPELDNFSFLTFGRLRPVHTNTVFYGWASLAMIGLAFYVIPRTCNTKIYSLKLGWWTLWLVNIAVFVGDILLMCGINNGTAEFREFIWPVMLVFEIGLGLGFYNFYKTIASRKTEELYISNWYIGASCIWTFIIIAIAYLPMYQRGLGETIIQGFVMHNVVGMWFMTFSLGLMYYFLPQALNKPIYSYALGVLALWTQMLFYTLLGSHHYIFSPFPWWMQTVAIVASAAMIVPVVPVQQTLQ